MEKNITRKIGGADIVLRCLIEEGVSVIFGYPGGSNLPFYDVLPYYKDKIRHILVRHEQGAALAADGYSRASGDVGVCVATSGPGATNLITGIANAYMDSIPMIAITGQVPSPLIGTDAFQEIDIIGVTIPITKQSYQIEDVNDIPRIMKEAFHLARSGRPGPVLIDLPKDLGATEFKKKFDYKNVKIELPGYQPTYKVEKESINQMELMIQTSKKPLIIMGHGVIISKAFTNFQKFIEKYQIPVVTTLLGHGGLKNSHPLHFGILGMHGMKYSNQAVSEADLIIGVGIRFDDRITGKLSEFGKNAKIIHIDIDPAEIDKIVKADLSMIADINTVLENLLKNSKKKTHPEWIKRLSILKETYSLEKVEQLNRENKMPDIHHGDLLRDIYEVTKGNAIIVTDVGQNQMLAWQYLAQEKPLKWLTSAGLGAMGYGLPAAMGAKLAKPKEDVWLIVGDGGMQMNIQELMTLVQDKINIKICIFNNFYLGMVRQWQELFYEQNYSEVDFLNPDYVKIAEAYGIKGFKARTIEEARKITRKISKLNEPVLVDFHIHKMGKVFPMVPPGTSLADTVIN